MRITELFKNTLHYTLMLPAQFISKCLFVGLTTPLVIIKSHFSPNLHKVYQEKQKEIAEIKKQKGKGQDYLNAKALINLRMLSDYGISLYGINRLKWIRNFSIVSIIFNIVYFVNELNNPVPVELQSIHTSISFNESLLRILYSILAPQVLLGIGIYIYYTQLPFEIGMLETDSEFDSRVKNQKSMLKDYANILLFPILQYMSINARNFRMGYSLIQKEIIANRTESAAEITLLIKKGCSLKLKSLPNDDCNIPLTALDLWAYVKQDRYSFIKHRLLLRQGSDPLTLERPGLRIHASIAKVLCDSIYKKTLTHFMNAELNITNKNVRLFPKDISFIISEYYFDSKALIRNAFILGYFTTAIAGNNLKRYIDSKISIRNSFIDQSEDGISPCRNVSNSKFWVPDEECEALADLPVIKLYTPFLSLLKSESKDGNDNFIMDLPGLSPF